ncbi:putative two-component response regulator [Mobilicoccus pelagius NBRC 104925]|uniref:Putative two-component response regulator n=1 Tax=Mobilicoccus pelagius NBRC 104925 TaxID=1089455 RepID=H5UPR4_9MICO|nr:putative two-component response regulator [Mobilicoccus pelagius NBRC 104925]
MEKRIRVLVVDDDTALRRAWAAIFSQAARFELVGDVANGADAVEFCRGQCPDIVLMDVRMPGMTGPEATRVLRSLDPPPVVMAFSNVGDVAGIRDMEAAGAEGYLVKSLTPAFVMAAIEETVAGRGVLTAGHSPAASLPIPASPAATPPGRAASERAPKLTDAEQAALDCLARGLSNAAIADELYVTEATVKTRLNRVAEKLGVHGRVSVVVRAMQLGLVQIEPDE